MFQEIFRREKLKIHSEETQVLSMMRLQYEVRESWVINEFNILYIGKKIQFCK